MKGKVTSSITFQRIFASQMHKKFRCATLESVEREASKTIHAVKKQYERDIYGLEGFNKQAERYTKKVVITVIFSKKIL